MLSSAQYAEEYGVHSEVARPTTIASLVSFAGGALLALVGVRMGLSGPPDSLGTPSSGPGLPMTIAGFIGLGIGMITLLPGLIESGAAAKARASAFLSYRRDLARQLGFVETPATPSAGLQPVVETPPTPPAPAAR